jgi:enamine deaminase RidA (YjgF/YER057c/UK114 family)
LCAYIVVALTELQKLSYIKEITMRKRVFSWLGREFVELSGEARPAANATVEAQELFQRFDQELKAHELSLDNTVRSRLWGRDRESRDLGSDQRVKILSGRARSASSSYIAPAHFDSDAKVAVDLLAMRPSRPDMQKQVVEYDPPIVPIRFLVYDSVVILSGVTAVLPTLENQLDNILPRITASLRDGGSSWDKVARVSFYLHRSQTIDNLNRLFEDRVKAPGAQREYCFVDGYSSPGKLCEVEVTAHV